MRSSLLIGVAVFAALMIPMVLFTGYIVPYMSYNKTLVNEREIIISRVIGFGTGMTYALDRQTGDEIYHSNQYAPFVTYKYTSIKYASSCRCVVSIYRTGEDEYSLLRRDDGSVAEKSGKVIERFRTVPFSEVRDEFDQAEQIISDVRQRYAYLLPEGPSHFLGSNANNDTHNSSDR
jgi:hypothetical protein